MRTIVPRFDEAQFILFNSFQFILSEYDFEIVQAEAPFACIGSPRRFSTSFISIVLWGFSYMSRSAPAFVSGGTVTWSEVEAARQHDALVAADFGRTKAGLGSCATYEGEAVAASAVASHYNSLPDRHRTLESGSEILRVRNFNNWIKSVLIAKHLPRGRGGHGHGLSLLLGPAGRGHRRAHRRLHRLAPGAA